MIKSHLLYQLSYGVIVGFLLLLGKVTAFFLITQIFFAVFLQNIAKTASNQASPPLLLYPLLSKLCTLNSKPYTPLSKKSRMAAAIISRPKIA